MIRRNNPGNIRYNPAINWQGQVGQENGFVIFSSLFYGLRAMMKILINDINAGTNTIKKLISEYAPPSENDTQGYILFVENFTGIPRNQVILSEEEVLSITQAMVKMESGELIALEDLHPSFIAAMGGNPIPTEPEPSGFPFIPALIALSIFT